MDELKSSYRKALYIWIAMVLSIFIYAVVVELVRINLSFVKISSALQDADTLKYILLMIAIMEFFLIRFIRGQILSGKPAGGVADANTPFRPMSIQLLTASIVTNAICESVAIYGLVIFFLTKNPFDFYIFMLLALVYFALYFPKYTQWEEWIQETERKG